MPQTEAGFVLTLVNTKSGLVCSLLGSGSQLLGKNVKTLSSDMRTLKNLPYNLRIMIIIRKSILRFMQQSKRKPGKSDADRTIGSAEEKVDRHLKTVDRPDQERLEDDQPRVRNHQYRMTLAP